jgi:hypothetical protein
VERGKKAEREGAREAAIEVHQEHVFSPATGTFDPKEAVLSGTLSSEVGDQLVAVALGEEAGPGRAHPERENVAGRSVLPGLVAIFFFRATPASGVKTGCAMALGYFVPTFILATFWRFPIPMGYPITALVAMHTVLIAAILPRGCGDRTRYNTS